MALSVQRIVFLSLILDLFAFTIPLPLFPRLVEWYITREHQTSGLLTQILKVVGSVRAYFIPNSLARQSNRWDTVLLGGLLGSLFSTLQCVISPYIGSLSDRFGRKRILLITMVGNLLSAIIWVQSTSFGSFLLSRAVGGISEGNVQLSIAIISDITSPETRSRDLSLIGIAFAICFCLGPPVGAWFSLHPVPFWESKALNVYATPALLTLILLLLEIALLVILLPETSGSRKQTVVQEKTEISSQPTIRSPSDRLKTLRVLGRVHGFFLALFSGVEFTLTFLSFDLFDWNNSQNGRLLMTIGIISALLQGGYVRRTKLKEPMLARRGVMACALATMVLTTLPFWAGNGHRKVAGSLLYVAAAFLAYTSATVVNALNSLASLQCDDDTSISPEEKSGLHSSLAKGKALGSFRSKGQLGRAVGPMLACASYWSFGPAVTYGANTVAMVLLYIVVRHSVVQNHGIKTKVL